MAISCQLPCRSAVSGCQQHPFEWVVGLDSTAAAASLVLAEVGVPRGLGVFHRLLLALQPNLAHAAPARQQPASRFMGQLVREGGPSWGGGDIRKEGAPRGKPQARKCSSPSLWEQQAAAGAALAVGAGFSAGQPHLSVKLLVSVNWRAALALAASWRAPCGTAIANHRHPV